MGLSDTLTGCKTDTVLGFVHVIWFLPTYRVCRSVQVRNNLHISPRGTTTYVLPTVMLHLPPKEGTWQRDFSEKDSITNTRKVTDHLFN
jgi:hypothetical protein